MCDLLGRGDLIEVVRYTAATAAASPPAHARARAPGIAHSSDFPEKPRARINEMSWRVATAAEHSELVSLFTLALPGALDNRVDYQASECLDSVIPNSNEIARQHGPVDPGGRSDGCGWVISDLRSEGPPRSCPMTTACCSVDLIQLLRLQRKAKTLRQCRNRPDGRTGVVAILARPTHPCLAMGRGWHNSRKAVPSAVVDRRRWPSRDSGSRWIGCRRRSP